MSTINSATFKQARVNNHNPLTGYYDVTLETNLITTAVNESGAVLISFRQSNSGSAWMALPFALPGNYWVFSYGVGSVTITNTNGDMPNGVDFKIVAIEI